MKLSVNINTYMEYIIFVLILIFLLILVYAITLPIHNDQQFLSFTSTAVPITIMDETNMNVCSNSHMNDQTSHYSNSLQKYCESWNYKYLRSESNLPYSEDNTNQSDKNGIILHIREISININLNRSLDIISNIASNMKYVIFDDSPNYLTNNNDISWDEIQKEIDNSELPPQLIHNIIAEGYPYILRNGIILHRGYLDYIFQNKNLPFEVPVIMSSKIFPRDTNGRSSGKWNTDIKFSGNQGGQWEDNESKVTKIPKIIHQTFETRCLPKKMAMAAYSWINRNVDYEYRYYDDYDRRQFIKAHFDNKVLEAYDSLIPGAYKADLWRYCVIYIEGGVYVDIKMGALVPLSRLIPHDTDLMIINDTHDMTLYNAFFAAKPKHPAILKTIQLVTERVLNKEYGEHILYPTGPMAMGTAILPLYGFGVHAENGRHIINNEIIQVYSHKKVDNDIIITDVDNTNLVKTRYDHSITESYINLITGRPHYRFLWNSRAIYKT